MLSDRKRTITVVDLSGEPYYGGRAFKRRRITAPVHDDFDDEADVEPKEDLKEFHMFDKLPFDVKKEIIAYFGEVELIGLSRTSKEFYEIQKSLIQPLLSSTRLKRLQATRPYPSNLPSREIEYRILFVKEQLKAHEEECEAMKQELKRVFKLKLENSNMTLLQKFDIWRQPDVPKTFRKYIQRGIQPEGAQDLWQFFQEKAPYGFAGRREEMSLQRVIETLEYHLQLEYDRENFEWTGNAANLELFSKYAAKLMELDYGGCYYDW